MIARLKQRIDDSRFTGLFYALFILVTVGTLLTLVCMLLINLNDRYILPSPAALQEQTPDNTRVALVLGGGIGDNQQPTDVVMSRLDAAAELYRAGTVDTLLVSGDNRFVDYNEPQVMQDYLMTAHQIPADNIQQDNAGRSTYESCERAARIFELDSVILVSQSSHLPRAIYLCRSFGIEAYGYATANSHTRLSQTLRELAANIKAVYNVYIRGEKTILGDPIPLR